MDKTLYKRGADGRTIINLHEGQARAWQSKRRTVAMCAGTQGGKTSFEPIWTAREIMNCGPGTYGVVSPTYTLQEAKVIPEFKLLFRQMLRLGDYTSSPVRRFTFSKQGARRFFGYDPGDESTVITFGYAENSDSLESHTWKAAVLDECAQAAFKINSWEAVNRRLAIAQGRILLGTTPYQSGGWMKTEIYDRYMNGDPDVDFIRFNSLANPSFPVESYERARKTMPAYRFDLFYRALFSRPSGLIYDNFSEANHVVPRFDIPPHFDRFCGLDFGGVNTAALFFARDPESGILYAYREYRAGGRTAKAHVEALLKGEAKAPLTVGGSKSEQQWRSEFSSAGLFVNEPCISSVECGLGRVYAAIARNEIRVMDHLKGWIEELQTYSRDVDSTGSTLESIADKAHFHLNDAARYIISWVKRPSVDWKPSSSFAPGQRSIVSSAPRGVFGRPL